MLCVNDPLVPVIVREYVPAAIEAVVLTVSVQVPEPVIDEGLHAAAMPVGIPDAVRATVPVNPAIAVIGMLKLADFPAVVVCVLGEDVIEKSEIKFPLPTVIATVAP